MKKPLFLYLFIIAALMNIFTYAYFSKKSEFDESQTEGLRKKIKDSIQIFQNKLTDADYFSIEKDQNAQNYFDNADIPQFASYEELSQLVNNQLIAYNDKPEGNPYTGMAPINGKKFIINKAKVLNHRWIIADCSDGQSWGEVLLKYFINPDKTVSFEVIQSVVFDK